MIEKYSTHKQINAIKYLKLIELIKIKQINHLILCIA